MKTFSHDSVWYEVLYRLVKEFMLPEWKQISIAIGLMIGCAYLTASQAYLIQPAIDQTLFNKAATAYQLRRIAFIVTGVSITLGICSYIQVQMMNILNIKITNKFRSMLYERFLTSDMEIFHNTSTGRMISNMTNDITAVMGCINLLLTGTFRNFFTAVFLVGVMFLMNWRLALVSFIAFPLAAIPLYKITRKMKSLVTQLQHGLEEMTIQIDDSLRSVRVVKAYNAENFELSRFQTILHSLYTNTRRITKISSIQSPFVQSLTGIGIGLVLWYGGSKVASGQTTPGTFFSFFTALMMAYKPIKGVAGYNTSLQMAVPVAKKLFLLLDYKPKVLDAADAVELTDIKGNIELKNVRIFIFPRSSCYKKPEFQT